MPAKAAAEKSVTDLLTMAANALTEAMTAQDAHDPQIQQALQALQGMLVQTVHAIRQQAASNKAQGGQQQQGSPDGQQMSAAPGQAGYGQGSPSQAGMVADMNGAGGGGGMGGPTGTPSPDEQSRQLGAVGKGMNG